MVLLVGPRILELRVGSRTGVGTGYLGGYGAHSLQLSVQQQPKVVAISLLARVAAELGSKRRCSSKLNSDLTSDKRNRRLEKRIELTHGRK